MEPGQSPNHNQFADEPGREQSQSIINVHEIILEYLSITFAVILSSNVREYLKCS